MPLLIHGLITRAANPPKNEVLGEKMSMGKKQNSPLAPGRPGLPGSPDKRWMNNFKRLVQTLFAVFFPHTAVEFHLWIYRRSSLHKILAFSIYKQITGSKWRNSQWIVDQPVVSPDVVKGFLSPIAPGVIALLDLPVASSRYCSLA